MALTSQAYTSLAIAAFSGGKSEDDVKTSTAGVAEPKTGL